jgi:hypothetical protein
MKLMQPIVSYNSSQPLGFLAEEAEGKRHEQEAHECKT